MRTDRRTVHTLAGPGITAARQVYLTVPSDAVRVAALVEISAAAAAMARTVVKLRRLDADLIAPHVSNRVDLRTEHYLLTLRPSASKIGTSFSAWALPGFVTLRLNASEFARTTATSLSTDIRGGEYSSEASFSAARTAA